MRRSICYCEPSIAKAGTVGTWRFIHTTATVLPKGTQIRFDMQSNGREIDWEIPSTNLKKNKSNVIYFQYEDGEILTASEVEVPQSYIPQFEFTLTRPVESGESFAIILGARDEKSAKQGAGNRCQKMTQRRRQFSILVDITGKQRFSEPEYFHMDIKGNKLHSIRTLTPSLVGRNKRFDIVARFEDEFGNLTGDAPDETLIEVTYEQQRENLNWKIFVPETGFITLPNIYFNEAGVYTIQLTDLATDVTWRSSPIRCSDTTDQLLLWGLLHGESDKVDATENIDNCLRHFRDEKALNFFSLSPFENIEETTNDIWKNCVQATNEFNEDERFTTFIGFQWVGEPKKEGVRQIIFLKDQKQLIRKKDNKGSSLEKLYKNFSPKDILSIPSFSMGKGYEFDFTNFQPEYERVVEIYNAWGSSEKSKEAGSTLPIACTKKTKGIQESREGSIVDALNSGCRFGFVAGGLDDRGIYEKLIDQDQVQYPAGLTAILAKDQTKISLIDAISKRHCYATTGDRIVVEFFLAQMMMGDEIGTGDKPGLVVNRHLSGFVAGTQEIETIEIIRNGETITTIQPKVFHTPFTYDDMVSLEDVVIHPERSEFPFAYYYLRVTQVNGHIAWSSPIWIDIKPKMEKKKDAKKK